MFTTFSLSTISNAIRKNGLPQIKGQMRLYNLEQELIGACALGQASINLNVSSGQIADSLDHLGQDEDGHFMRYGCEEHEYKDTTFSLSGYVAHLNDKHDYTFEQIADYLDSLPDPSTRLVMGAV